MIPLFTIVGGVSGFTLMIVGFGVLSLLGENSLRPMYIGCQVPLPIVWVSAQFPILAPRPFSNSTHALAFPTFIRYFAQASTLRNPLILYTLLT
ncbi:hypothetical protein C8Q79DRAFT_1007382 [Trametes meyenii]|nr:hypothetical protein C8Q79DRAFT_1007382 [Trametes meyenii]